MNDSDMMKDLEELETLIPEARLIHVHGIEESITVAPLTIGQIARMAKSLRVIVAAAESEGIGELKIADLLMSYPDEMISIVSAAIDKSADWFGQLRADAALSIAVAVFEVNVPFFVQSLGPIVASIAARLTNMAGGLKDSKGSATQDTTLPKPIP